MHEAGPQCRGEAGHFRLPVRQERGRQDQQRRASPPPVLEPGQEGQHLDRLAQAHVVGQARAQAQAGEKPQPFHARFLVDAQRGVEIGARPSLFQVFRIAQLGQHFAQPFARVHERPLALGVALVVVGQVARAPASNRMPSTKEMPSSACAASSFQCVQGLGKFLAVDLDPLPAQQHEPILGGQQVAPFGVGKFLVAQGQMHLESRTPGRLNFFFRLSPMVTPTRGRGRFFHQSGSRTSTPLSSKTGTSLRKRYASPRPPGQGLIDVARVDHVA